MPAAGRIARFVVLLFIAGSLGFSQETAMSETATSRSFAIHAYSYGFVGEYADVLNHWIKMNLPVIPTTTIASATIRCKAIGGTVGDNTPFYLTLRSSQNIAWDATSSITALEALFTSAYDDRTIIYPEDVVPGTLYYLDCTTSVQAAYTAANPQITLGLGYWAYWADGEFLTFPLIETTSFGLTKFTDLELGIDIGMSVHACRYDIPDDDAFTLIVTYDLSTQYERQINMGVNREVWRPLT